MTLGGLAAAVGLVIDDAIVVVENIALHRDAGQGRVEAIHSALSEITVPLIGSTITPIVVFLPLIAITGVTGVFFRALAITVGVSLLTSLALALTWTPTLEPVLHSPQEQRSRSRAERSQREGQVAGRRRSRPGRTLPPRDRLLRTLAALRAGSPAGGLPSSAAVLIVASFFCYKALGLRPAAGDGRRRLRSRLHHSRGHFAGGDQPHGQPHRADASRRFPRSRATRGAPVCNSVWLR